MLEWIKSLFSRKSLTLVDDERQNLTTFSMMAGEVSLLVAIGLLVWVLRYSWPAEILKEHAGALIDGLFKVVFGLLALMGLQTFGKVVIAIGGKIKAAAFGASLEAESEQ